MAKNSTYVQNKLKLDFEYFHLCLPCIKKKTCCKVETWVVPAWRYRLSISPFIRIIMNYMNVSNEAPADRFLVLKLPFINIELILCCYHLSSHDQIVFDFFIALKWSFINIRMILLFLSTQQWYTIGIWSFASVISILASFHFDIFLILVGFCARSPR